jgi:outer membrane protein
VTLVACVAVPCATASADPISLRAAVETALAHHPNLERGAADHDVAAARIGRARSAYLPHINLQASGRDDYQDPSDFTSSANMLGFANQFIYSGQVAVSQLITDSGLTKAQLEGARANEQQAHAQLVVSELDVELGVVQAYLGVLQNKELIDVSTGAIALVDEQLKRATALYKATMRPEIDVLSAQTQLAQAQLTLERDRNSVAAALVVLQNAMGTNEPRVVDVLPVDINPLAEEGKVADELTATSLGQRPELAALRDSINAADAAAHVAQTRTLPTVSVQAGAYTSGGVQPPLLGLAQWTPALGAFGLLAVNWDLYLGRDNYYELAGAHAQARSARAELELEKQAITSSVSQAALAVQIAREALTVATSTKTLAERQLQLAKARYDSGVGNFVELNDARSGLVNVERQEVMARYSLAASRVALARELGRGPAGLATKQ